MWCIIKVPSVNTFARNEGCSLEGLSAAGYSRGACPLTISPLTTTYYPLPGFVSQKLSIDTWTWIYLRYTENNLVESVF